MKWKSNKPFKWNENKNQIFFAGWCMVQREVPDPPSPCSVKLMSHPALLYLYNNLLFVIK